MPTYNRAQYIGAAIDSILRQTYQYWRLLIYDDGSDDETMEIARGFTDERVQRHGCLGHHGVVHARNRLLAMTSFFDFAAWQDDDDLSNIHRLEIQLGIMRERGCAQTCSLYDTFGEHVPDIAEKTPILPKTPAWGAFASTMFRPQGAPQFRDTGRGQGEDTEWFQKLERLHGEPRYIHPQKLYYVRKHADQITAR